MNGPALVILAAGESARLGECKALAQLRDKPRATPLSLLLEAGRGLGDATPLVVTGAHHAAIAAATPAGVELVFNQRWSEGRTGSVLCARDLRPGRDLCLTPVDVPLVPHPVFVALRDAWVEAGSPPNGWLAPATPDGRPGHPIVVGRELLSAWQPQSYDEPLRRLRALSSPLWTAPVPSSAIHDDLDTPTDLAALRKRLATA